MAQSAPTYDKALYERILLRTLRSFSALCKREGLRYFLSFGSAIGAVRHGGMIPWDDDIDVCMPREDYERFLSLGEWCTVRLDGKDERFRIVSLRTSPERSDVPFSYAKWTDTTSTIWEQRRYRCTFGVFVDVFPLERVSSVQEAQTLCEEYRRSLLQYKRSFRSHSLSDWKEAILGARFHDLGAWTMDVCALRGRRDKYRREFIALDESLSGRGNDGEYCTVLDTPYSMKKVTCPIQWFSDTVKMPFGDVEAPLPVGYDSILSQIYGDYMTPPPEEGRISAHHHYFVDLQNCLTPQQVEGKLKGRQK